MFYISTSGVQTGYTLCIEFNSIRQLVTHSVKKSINQATENKIQERLIRALGEHTIYSKTRVVVSVAVAALAIAVFW